MIIARPQPAHWFRLLVAREDLHQALPLLADHQGIQLDDSSEKSEHQPLLSSEISERLQQFQHISQRYHPFWPQSTEENSDSILDVVEANNPIEILDKALTALERWAFEADPLIQRSLAQKVQHSDLNLYYLLATHLENSNLDMSLLESGGGPWLTTQLFVLPEALPELPSKDPILFYPIATEEHSFLIVVAGQKQMQTISDRVSASKGRLLPFPHWPSGTKKEVLAEIKRRILSSEEQIERLNQALLVLNYRHDVAQHVKACNQLQWFFSAVEKIRSGHCFAQVKGWTDNNNPLSINQLLNSCNIRALMDLSEKGPEKPPILMVNPWWAKPFELFSKLLGTPSLNEADPSRFLSIIAPLMFGFMFGDVGQGFVLALAGFLLRNKFEAAWLLITGGISSLFFGFLFGSIFCREDIISPLWISPTHHPLPLLATPLILGFFLILSSLALNGLSHTWSRKGRTWWLQDSGILIFYMGLAGMVFYTFGGVVAAVGLGWFVTGNLLAGASIGKLLIRLAHFLEAAMQLVVNTLSFARVGAFALAHAGLSQAVVTLSELNENAFMVFLVLLLGNLLILALEGLVVSVQTTRLILFEFFVRFLKGEGRPFQPLSPPPK